MGCSVFLAFFITFLGAECTKPTKSFAKYDQVLQLGPVLLPERVWYQALRLHQPFSRVRIDLIAEKTHFMMNSLECFMSRLTSR